LEIIGAPMMSVICHCTSCRTAGRALDARSPVAPIVDAAGGTPVVLWRKDRVRCIAGSEHLEAHRLAPEAPSRRIVTSCCQTPILGDFMKGFWVSIYHGRISNAPRPSMRVMTGNLPEGVTLPDDGLPHYGGRPPQFIVRLLVTWAAMGFRSPRLAGVPD
jgi:hypothetical protein